MIRETWRANCPKCGAQLEMMQHGGPVLPSPLPWNCEVCGNPLGEQNIWLLETTGGIDCVRKIIRPDDKP